MHITCLHVKSSENLISEYRDLVFFQNCDMFWMCKIDKSNNCYGRIYSFPLSFSITRYLKCIVNLIFFLFAVLLLIGIFVWKSCIIHLKHSNSSVSCRNLFWPSTDAHSPVVSLIDWILDETSTMLTFGLSYVQ